MTAETRTFAPDLEVRSSERTIVGIAVPFDTPTEIAGRFTEVFRRGSFTRTIAERGDRVKLLGLHDGTTRFPVGKATLLREDVAGLYAEFRVAKTVAGDEVLELVRDGALDSLSVGFVPVRDQWSNTRDRVDRIEVNLREVSVVTEGAYDGARILAVRSTQPLRTALLRRRLDLY